jgi:hypothetical protein
LLFYIQIFDLLLKMGNTLLDAFIVLFEPVWVFLFFNILPLCVVDFLLQIVDLLIFIFHNLVKFLVIFNLAFVFKVGFFHSL